MEKIETVREESFKSVTATSLRAFIVLAVLFGGVYPLAMTGVAQLFMHEKANGSLISVNGKIVGSERIAQKFSQAKYFHPRPSAVDYDASGSGGSNLGPTSKKLIDTVKERIFEVRKENGIPAELPLPSDMVTASSSGLDPNISLENALLQAKRVAKARNVGEDTVKMLIKENLDRSLFGVWGENVVNVLKLNLALDAIKAK